MPDTCTVDYKLINEVPLCTEPCVVIHNYTDRQRMNNSETLSAQLNVITILTMSRQQVCTEKITEVNRAVNHIPFGFVFGLFFFALKI